MSLLTLISVARAQSLTASEPKTLRVLLDSPLLTLDPLAATDGTSQRVGNLIHAGLVVRGRDLKPRADLAQSWRVRGSIFTFKLRRGLKFQDGSPLNANHVVDCVRLYAGMAGPSAPLSRHLNVFSKIKKVFAQDEHQVVIETDGVHPYFLNDLYLLKIYKQTPVGFIGAGRFQLEKEYPWGVILKRWSDFYEMASPNQVARLVLRYTRDDTTRYQQFLKGDVDLLPSSLSISKTEYLQKNPVPGTHVKKAPGISLQYLAFNFRHPILSRLQVRQAIAHALDIDGIVAHRFSGFTTRALSLLSPLLEDYAPDLPRYGYDIHRAENLLDQAGFRRANPGGWRFEIGFKTSPSKEGIDLARIVAAQLATIGIKVKIQTVELALLLSDLKAGRFEMFSSRLLGIIDPSIYYRVFHSSQIGSLNRGAYQNPEADRLLDEAMKVTDACKRREKFALVQKIVASELPYITLWHWMSAAVASDRIQNDMPYANGDLLALNEIIIKE